MFLQRTLLLKLKIHLKIFRHVYLDVVYTAVDTSGIFSFPQNIHEQGSGQRFRIIQSFNWVREEVQQLLVCLSRKRKFSCFISKLHHISKYKLQENVQLFKISLLKTATELHFIIQTNSKLHIYIFNKLFKVKTFYRIIALTETH